MLLQTPLVTLIRSTQSSYRNIVHILIKPGWLKYTLSRHIISRSSATLKLAIISEKKLDQLSYHSFILLRQCMEWIYLHIAGLKFKSFYYVCCGRAGTAQNYYISAVSDCLLAPSTRADDFPNNLAIQWVKSDFYERKTKNLTIIGVN